MCVRTEDKVVHDALATRPCIYEHGLAACAAEARLPALVWPTAVSAAVPTLGDAPEGVRARWLAPSQPVPIFGARLR